MHFEGIQKTLTYHQYYQYEVEKVFPLLCPVREKDWLDGWEYKMIHSHSGLIERDCVFTTPHHGVQETVWHVTQYDPQRHVIEFVRVTPGETVVRININASVFENAGTKLDISYQFTSLSVEQNKFANEELENDFIASMKWWERALNHYMETGEMLNKE